MGDVPFACTWLACDVFALLIQHFADPAKQVRALGKTCLLPMSITAASHMVTLNIIAFQALSLVHRRSIFDLSMMSSGPTRARIPCCVSSARKGKNEWVPNI
eukprot:4067651-Amphidinium_carterae.2